MNWELDTWLIQPFDHRAANKDKAFEQNLSAIHKSYYLCGEAQQAFTDAIALERQILTRQIKPTGRQQARFWYVLGQMYFQACQYHEAFEAFNLCDASCDRNDTLAQAQLHIFLAESAFQIELYEPAFICYRNTVALARSLLAQKKLHFRHGDAEALLSDALLHLAYLAKQLSLPEQANAYFAEVNGILRTFIQQHAPTAAHQPLPTTVKSSLDAARRALSDESEHDFNRWNTWCNAIAGYFMTSPV